MAKALRAATANWGPSTSAIGEAEIVVNRRHGEATKKVSLERMSLASGPSRPQRPMAKPTTMMIQMTVKP